MPKILYSAILTLLITLTSSNVASAREGSPFIIEPRATWAYHASEAAPANEWMKADYDASNWRMGSPGFGYGDDDDSTLLDDMEDSYQRVYIRHKFNLEAVPKKLYLYINYDDAFVVYVNGKHVKTVGIDGEEIESHEAKGFEIFKLKRKHFVDGVNIIAIEGVNRSLGSSDFSLWPVLATTRKAFGEQ